MSSFEKTKNKKRKKKKHYFNKANTINKLRHRHHLKQKKTPKNIWSKKSIFEGRGRELKSNAAKKKKKLKKDILKK